MNRSTRALGLSLLLLLLFLGATVTLQWWLNRETHQLQTSAIAEQRAHLLQAIAISGKSPQNWDATFQQAVGAMLGGTLELVKPGDAPLPAPRDFHGLSLIQDLPSAPGWKAQLHFSMPAILRIQVLHHRTVAVIVVLSLLVAVVPLLLVMLGTRRATVPEGASRMPWAMSRANDLGMEHFARISNERTTALEIEQGARQRAEENLQVNRTLLSQSVDERVRLGRELHDNICQTLYAVCLTLESVQKKNALAPELSQRVDLCMTELRRLNQEVRSYLQDLEPARLNSQSFTEAVAGMITPFMAEDGVRIEQRLDEEAVALIPSHQIADVMNILREAVSNALRHGHARNISLLAGRNDREIALAVQDDGSGFTGSGNGGGHGLANMKARAAALGGSIRVESTPGKGTRVLLHLPVASPA
ncbi:MAG: ATP-binding protein [Lacunisphaera sp.]